MNQPYANPSSWFIITRSFMKVSMNMVKPIPTRGSNWIWLDYYQSRVQQNWWACAGGLCKNRYPMAIMKIRRRHLFWFIYNSNLLTLTQTRLKIDVFRLTIDCILSILKSDGILSIINRKSSILRFTSLSQFYGSFVWWIEFLKYSFVNWKYSIISRLTLAPFVGMDSLSSGSAAAGFPCSSLHWSH